jgi:hypothetical protein
VCGESSELGKSYILRRPSADDLEEVVESLFDAVHELYIKASARNFLLVDVPPLDRCPGGAPLKVSFRANGIADKLSQLSSQQLTSTRPVTPGTVFYGRTSAPSPQMPAKRLFYCSLHTPYSLKSWTTPASSSSMRAMWTKPVVQSGSTSCIYPAKFTVLLPSICRTL